MNRAELFDLLEMDSLEDFGYFEQFAELVESEEEISFDDFHAIIAAAESDILAEINLNYFTEIEKSFPDDCDDFYEIIESIINNLKLLARDFEDEGSRREYADQLFKFHEMYTKKDGAKVDGKPCSVMEALAEYRASMIEHTSHCYDFEGSLDYQPDYISMRVGGYEDEYESDDFMQDD